MNFLRKLFSISAILLLVLIGISTDANAQQKPIPVPQINPPTVFRYDNVPPRPPIPSYYYHCRQMYLYFPTSQEFIKTIEAKKDLNYALDLLYSKGESEAANLRNSYEEMISAIVGDLSTASGDFVNSTQIFTFEKAIPSIEECGRALNLWPEASVKINSAFTDYYLRNSASINAKFQFISTNKFSRSTLLLYEAFISNYKNSQYIPLSLSNELSQNFNLASSRLEIARKQYLGEYSLNGHFSAAECAIEDEELKMRGRIDTERLFPKIALSRNIDGEVSVAVSVDKFGRASGASFTSVSDEVFREEAILTALKNARYWPKIKDCNAVESIANQKIIFRMGY